MNTKYQWFFFNLIFLLFIFLLRKISISVVGLTDFKAYFRTDAFPESWPTPCSACRTRLITLYTRGGISIGSEPAAPGKKSGISADDAVKRIHLVSPKRRPGLCGAAVAEGVAMATVRGVRAHASVLFRPLCGRPNFRGKRLRRKPTPSSAGRSPLTCRPAFLLTGLTFASFRKISLDVRGPHKGGGSVSTAVSGLTFLRRSPGINEIYRKKFSFKVIERVLCEEIRSYFLNAYADLEIVCTQLLIVRDAKKALNKLGNQL